MAIECLMEKQDQLYKPVQEKLVPVSEALSSEEISQISDLSKEMFLEYCEIEILRDQDSLMQFIDIDPNPSLSPFCISDLNKNNYVAAKMATLIEVLLT